MLHNALKISRWVMVLVFLGACGEVRSSVTGTWSGTLTFGNAAPEAVVMTLEQQSSSVSGRLTYRGGQLPLTGTTTGSLISLTAEGAVSLAFEGGVSGSAMSGSVTLTSAAGASSEGAFSVSRESGG